jgi:hypothetical protein
MSTGRAFWAIAERLLELKSVLPRSWNILADILNACRIGAEADAYVFILETSVSLQFLLFIGAHQSV